MSEVASHRSMELGSHTIALEDWALSNSLSVVHGSAGASLDESEIA